MGHNTPLADLFVLAPDKKTTFLVDVKGMKTKNFWQIKQKKQTDNLFYVLAYVPTGLPNRFFIFNQKRLTEAMNNYQFSGVKFDLRFSGINWGMALPQEGMWEELPIADKVEAAQ